jgi:aspartate-semialdehyde dehydrogenase
MINKEKYNVCVVGATGTVGSKILEILVERKFPARIFALASDKSESTVLKIGKMEFKVESTKNFCFKDADIVFLATESEVSRDIANQIKKVSNCVIIDNSSHFRMKQGIPLVVPEVNSSSLNNIARPWIICNPNCSTIQMAVVLKPIHDLFKIRRVVVSTYQAVSGAGRAGENELKSQIHHYVKNEHLQNDAFPKQIFCNIIPQIDVFMEDGTTKEEQKMVQETNKILDTSIMVHANCARVGVLNSHAEYINIETNEPFALSEIRDVIKNAPGIILEDDQKSYKTPLEVSGKDEVFVARVRRDYSSDNALSLWCVADNLRKGAALNAIQIAETLITKSIL